VLVPATLVSVSGHLDGGQRVGVDQDAGSDGISELLRYHQ
jgi:hypothetical protein